MTSTDRDSGSRLDARSRLVLNVRSHAQSTARLGVPEWILAVQRSVMARAAEISPSPTLDPRLVCRLAESSRYVRRAFSVGELERMVGQLSDGTLDSLYIEYLPGSWDFVLYVDFSPSGLVDAVLAIDEEHLPLDMVDAELERSAVQALTTAHTLLGAPSGFITYDALLNPYEDVTQSRITGPADLESCARGYYWANLLTRQHISGLGGVDRIRREAPVARVIVGGLEPGEALVLQSTERIEQWTPRDATALRDYFEPLLVPRRPILDIAQYSRFVVEPIPEPTPPESVGVGALRFTDDVDWSALEVTFMLRDSTGTPELDRAMERAIREWAFEGQSVGFDGKFLREVGRPGFRLRDDGRATFGFDADMGDTDTSALDDVIRRVRAAASDHDALIIETVIGHGVLDEDDPVQPS